MTAQLRPHYRKASMPTHRAGIMGLPWKDGMLEIHADKISGIEYRTPADGEEDGFHVKIKLDVKAEENHHRFNLPEYSYDIKNMVRDMYRRALNGEDVDFREYLPDGHPTLRQHPEYKHSAPSGTDGPVGGW